jgi:hypothetical protein
MISKAESEARDLIHALPDDVLTSLVIEKYNCKDVERSCIGGIWIADPQTGHWLSSRDLIEFADWIKKQEEAA